MKDLIVVGGSAAGVTAGIYAVRAGLSVTLITENFGGQLLLTEKVENYTGFKSIPSFDLAMKFREHLSSYKEIEVIEGFKVTKVEKKKEFFSVKISDGKEFEAKAVIIATGKRPKKLEVKGAIELKNKGVHYCAICDGPLYKEKEVAVVGGGYSGIEEALYLSNICPKVFILEYGKELEGEEITRKQLMQKKNIEILTETEVTKVLGEKTVEGLRYKAMKGKEKEIKVSAVFVNIGELPNSEFVEVEKTSFNEIKINEKNETSIPGLFAAGDVTDNPVHQLIVAAGEGCKAAINVNEYLRGKKS